MNKRIVIVFAVIVILIGILGYLGKLPFAISGFSTLALSQADFTSNDASLGGKAWILSVVQDGAGQSAYGTFTASDSDGSKSNQFTITTLLDKNYATYNILNQGIPIQKFTYTARYYNPLAPNKGCDEGYMYHHPTQYLTVFGTVFCYKLSTDGYYGTVGSANNNFQTTIKVSGTGGTESCTISNTDARSCTSSGGRVIASWAGSLVSGQAAPQPTDQDIIAIYNTNRGGWMTADKSAYTDWLNAKKNIALCLDTEKSTSCFDKANSLESTLLGGKSFVSSGGDVAAATGTSSNGQLVMMLPTQIQFPLITMRVKADLIGINIPVGMPKIVSVSSERFQTGQQGIITIAVKNVGTGIGSFDIGTTCSNGFIQSGNSIRASGVAIGESRTVYLPVTSNVLSGNLQGTCTVTARDVNNPVNIATSTVSVSSSALTICSSGDKRISGNTIQQCQNNGWITIQDCGAKRADVVNGQPQCVDTTTPSSGSSGGSSCSWYSIGCQLGKVGSMLNIFRYILGAVILFISFFTSKRLSEQYLFRSKSDKKIIYILAALITLGVGVLVYIFLFTIVFWIILIGLVGSKIAIKFIKPF